VGASLLWEARELIFALGGKGAPRAYHNTWCWLCFLQYIQIAAQMAMGCSDIVVVQHSRCGSGLEHILRIICECL
jgi:hypothetical protein